MFGFDLNLVVARINFLLLFHFHIPAAADIGLMMGT